MESFLYCLGSRWQHLKVFPKHYLYYICKIFYEEFKICLHIFFFLFYQQKASHLASFTKYGGRFCTIAPSYSWFLCNKINANHTWTSQNLVAPSHRHVINNPMMLIIHGHAFLYEFQFGLVIFFFRFVFSVTNRSAFTGISVEFDVIRRRLDAFAKNDLTQVFSWNWFAFWRLTKIKAENLTEIVIWKPMI